MSETQKIHDIAQKKSNVITDIQHSIFDLAEYGYEVQKSASYLEELLEKELRSTSQRVNLFEKVKIPEAKENIRIIGVYLGDQQTAAVVRGKISKKKLVEVGQ